MFARSATLPDAFAIEQLIQVHVADGTLLRAHSPRSARTSATSSLSKMTARSSGAAPCTFTACTWQRFVRLRLPPKRRAVEQAGC